MPFAGYPDFDACVLANKDKGDPSAYCGAIKSKVEKASLKSPVSRLSRILSVLRGADSKSSISAVVQELTEVKVKKTRVFGQEDVLYCIGMAVQALGDGDTQKASTHLEDALVKLGDEGLQEEPADVVDPSDQYTDAERTYASAISEARKFGRVQMLDDVEIFKVGTWNGDKYSSASLDELVENFRKLQGTVKPPVKLGHGEDQKLLKAEGLPAAGWITGLRRMGDVLYAQISDVPKVIADLVRRKAYRRVSAEIYPMYKDSSGRLFRNVLRAVAFLGGDVPAVESLRDIAALYAQGSGQDFKRYELETPVYKFKITGRGIGGPKVKVRIHGMEEVLR